MALVEVLKEEKPTLAKEETDADLDDREVVSVPYTGVDDVFFNSNPDNGDEGDPDSEEEFPNNLSILETRAGRSAFSANFSGRFPHAPGFVIPDIEIGSVIQDSESIPDVNIYQQKKTLAQGMIDLALFSANANQLRYVLESFNRHPYYYPGLVLISFSLFFQVAVGIGLIWNATYNVNNKEEIRVANKINNFTVIGIFLVTIINVFISAFGVTNET